MGRTRIKVEFVIDHDGDRMWPFQLDRLVDFIDAGIREVAPPVKAGQYVAILPGAKLNIAVVRRGRD